VHSPYFFDYVWLVYVGYLIRGSKFSARVCITCLCSYATTMNIPRRLPMTLAIVSLLTRGRLCVFSTSLSCSRYFSNFGYSSESTPTRSISCKTAFFCASRRFAVSSFRNLRNVHPFCSSHYNPCIPCD
jgi:hypothetical protein